MDADAAADRFATAQTEFADASDIFADVEGMDGEVRTEAIEMRCVVDRLGDMAEHAETAANAAADEDWDMFDDESEAIDDVDVDGC